MKTKSNIRTCYLLFFTVISSWASGQSSNSSCCSCYNFFSDDNVAFLRDSTIHYVWQEENNSWIENFISIYFYDERAKIKEHIIYRSDVGIQERSPANRHTYNYDIEQRQFERTGYRWDGDENAWIKVNRAVYRYDSVNILNTRMDYNWSVNYSDWVNNFLYHYEFDRGSENYNTLAQKWDPEKNIWYNDAESEIYASGSQKTRITRHWNPDRNTWMNYQQMINSYSSDGLLAYRKLNNWNEELRKWVDFRNYSYSYDEKGRETEWICYGRDDHSGNPEGRGRQLYSYDDYGNRIETLRFGWDRESHEWVLRARELTWWSSLLKAEFEDLKSGDIRVYPNPFEDYAIIELNDFENTRRIELIDISGRVVKILENVNTPSVVLERDNLQSGIYILKIYAGSMYTVRLVIE